MSALPARSARLEHDPLPPSPRAPHRRGIWIRRTLLVLMTALTSLVCATAVLVATAPPASAADQGAGFGTWAPLSSTGWHGSMLVGGVHTYCILPGLPAPTGESVDHGVRPDARGLSPAQLTGINMLVTRYGQTGDAVQAAAVGWAVKAIADRSTTLRAWGYPGDSLAGAVHWTFDRHFPAHASAVAQLAEQYYAEAQAVTVPGSDGTIALSTDPADARRGAVRLDGGAGTTAEITLAGAVFADTGAPTLSPAPIGVDIPIVASSPSDDGAPFVVTASARFTAEFAPAVRYITTAGQQDTAGPGGSVEYVVEAQDETARPVVFSPGIRTQVVQAEIEGGPYVDDVTIDAVEGVWPRSADGALVPLVATAVVYRTEAAPAESAEIPADAVPVGELSLTTDPATGGGTYRVESAWQLPGAGWYTAVWTISTAHQAPEVARHLPHEYVWAEKFGTPSQITRVTPPPPPPTAEPTPPVEAAPAMLAATGPFDQAPRLAGAGAAALVLGAALLAHLSARRRRQATA
jgi:hypothetical protein